MPAEGVFFLSTEGSVEFQIRYKEFAMKTKIQFLAIAMLWLGSLTTTRIAFAADSRDHAALAKKYGDLAGAQQDIIDDNLKLKLKLESENYRTYMSGKMSQRSGYEAMDRHFDAVIDDAAKQKADFLRFVKWHRLETEGAGSKVESLIAEQQAIIDQNQKLKKESHVGYINEKVTSSSRYAETDRQYDDLITAASMQLADLQGYAEWHRLAGRTESEIAALIADQQAVVDQQMKIKADNHFRYANGKVTPSSDYADADKKIEAASRELKVLKEFQQN
jgi:hypothetical protein